MRSHLPSDDVVTMDIHGKVSGSAIQVFKIDPRRIIACSSEHVGYVGEAIRMGSKLSNRSPRT